MPINSTLRLFIPNLFKLLPVSFLLGCFLQAPSELSGQTLPASVDPEAGTLHTKTASNTDTFLCGGTFFKRLFIEGQSAVGYKIVPAPNETFFCSASVGNRTIIAHTNKNLEPLWVRSIDMAPGPDANLLDLRMDAGGNLIGVGNTNSAPVQCFAFKVNATNGQLIWRSILNNPTNCYFTRILEKRSGENYFLLGQTDDLVSTPNGCDALLMEIDRNTGALLWDRQYTLGDCEIFDEVFLKNDRIYACGRFALAPGGHDHYRAALTAMDTAGNVQWSRCYLFDGNHTARLFANALQPDGDGIVLSGWGNDHAVNLTETTLQLMKTDSMGRLTWAKQYDIVGGNEERSYRLLNLPDGYLLAGWFRRPTTAAQDIYVMKTDKGGNFLWGKSYGANGDDNLRDILLVADTLYLIGSRQNAQIFDVLLGKVDLNGNTDGQCGFVKDLDVLVSDYTDLIDDVQPLTPIDVAHNYAPAALPAPSVETVETEVICQKICVACDSVKIARTVGFCAGDSVLIGGVQYNQPGTVVDIIPGSGTDCDTVVTYTLVFDISFLKTMGAANSDEAALGVYDAKDGNLYVSGVAGGDSLVIIKMTPGGEILWADRINFINDRIEYITEMFVDDEGMLVGAGTFSNIQSGFIFRYDPAAHALLWSKRIIFTDCEVLGILQKPNAGAYRIHLNFPVPFQNGSRSLQVDVSKTTGDAILGTAARYQVDTADVINNQVLYQDKIYACGGYTFQGSGPEGRRHGLTRFDLNGNVEWTRLGPADQNTVQRITGNDLIIDNSHIISVCSGDDDGTSLDSTTIFLQKNTLDGDLVWIRKFDLSAGFSNEIAEEVVSVADGYVLMGRNRSGPGDLFFLKTDKEGHLQWAKKLDIANDNFAGKGRDQSQLLAFANGLYFAAMTREITTGKSDMLFGRVNLKGEIGANCGFIQPLDVLEIPLNVVQNTPAALLRLGQGTAWADFDKVPVPASTSLPVNDACPGCASPGCDTVEIAQIVEFCPGDIVQIGGDDYTQPGTVSDTLPGTGTDCDTIVTYTLQFYQNSTVQIQCPGDVSVEAVAGAGSATVDYNLPVANTDCPCSPATPELLQGLASGSAFPLGVTQVCYEAADACGGANSCCFTVNVQAAPPEDACDVKITPCVKFEILGIFQNPAKQRTYRMRVTNSCANKLIYTTFQLPDGVVADAPATGTTYTAPSGRQYEARNPNFSPAWSVRFKAIGDGIADGQSDVFEYTLPPQSEPLFIHATAKLYPQVYTETHLNVFDCPVQQTSSRPVAAGERHDVAPAGTMSIFPNPATDVLKVRLPGWADRQVHLRVSDAFGRLLYEQASGLRTDVMILELPAGWPAGVYYLEVSGEKGERETGRFVRMERR